MKLAYLIVVLLSSSAFALAEDNSKWVANATESWQKQRQKIKSVRVRIEGEWIYPKESFSLREWASQTTDRVIPFSRYYIFDFENNRLRMECDDGEYLTSLSQVVRTNRTTVVQNGKLTARVNSTNDPKLKSNQAGKDGGVITGSLKGVKFDHVIVPILTSCGRVPCLDGYPTPESLNVFPLENTLKPDAIRKLFDKPCRVIVNSSKTKPHHEVRFWLGEDQAELINCWEHVNQSKVDLQLIINRLKNNESPQGWTLNEYWDGLQTDIVRVKVKEWEFNPTLSDSDFQISFQKGDSVFEVNREKNWPNDPKQNPKKYSVADENGILVPVNTVSNNSSTLIYWSIGIGVGVLVVLLTLIVKIFHKKGS